MIRMINCCKPPTLRVSTFVDDVSQISMGRYQEVANSAVNAAIIFCAGMRAAKLKVSHKSVIVSTSPRLSSLIARVLKKFSRVEVRVSSAARDLGVLNNPSMSRRRNTTLQAGRLVRGALRFRRIGRLAKIVRKARNLSQTGALPQSVWGVSTIGLAPTQLNALRRQFAAATGIQAMGRCATTAIAIAVGPRNDPAVKLAVDQVALYIDLWRFDPSLRQLSVRHWSDIADHVLGADRQQTLALWNNVSGPQSASLAVLHDSGWAVRSPVKWTDPSGDDWIPDFRADKSEFLDAVARFVLIQLWKGAAKSWSGLGLQSGVEWSASMSLHRQLSASKRPAASSSHSMDSDMELQEIMEDTIMESWSEFAITWLELFLCGGYWPAQRAAPIHGISELCPRCRKEPETALHLIWTCEHNAYIDDPRVSESQELVRQAVDGVESVPCLWLRGLLPVSLVPVNSPMILDLHVSFLGAAPRGQWPPGVYYTDSSGGPFSSYPLLRRCGCGVAVIDMDYDYETPDPAPFCWGAFFALPGAVQTVPRGELFAIVVVVERIGLGLVEVRSDSKLNVDLFNKGRDECLASQHSDLWQRLWSILEAGAVQLKLTWVKGHSSDYEVAIKYDVSVADMFGNSYADGLADRAADEAQVSPQDSVTVRWHFSIVRRIQARAVTILTRCLHGRISRAAPRTPQPRPVVLPLAAMAMQSAHRVTMLAGTLHCYKCHAHSPSDLAGIRRWLHTPCIEDRAMTRVMTVGTTKPSAVPVGREIQVGRSVLHRSHTLHVYRGLYFCSSCGYTASAKAQKLTVQCEGPGLERRGTLRVLNLRRGILPSGVTRWPNDVSLNAASAIDLLEDWR